MLPDKEKEVIAAVLEDMEPPDIPEVKEEEVIPLITDLEWNAYALSKLDKEELDEQGHPTVDGLRRITELLLGPVIGIDSKVITSPNPENQLRATVECCVSILWKKFPVYENDGYSIRTFTEVADVYLGNVKEEVYAQFPTAFASTRAEGRALRKALRLRKVVSAEEMSNKTADEAFAKNPISGAQLKAIDLSCKRLNINVTALLKSLTGRENFPANLVKKLNRLQGSHLTEKLNGYSCKPESIPKSCIGYKNDWMPVDEDD